LEYKESEKINNDTEKPLSLDLWPKWDWTVFKYVLIVCTILVILALVFFNFRVSLFSLGKASSNNVIFQSDNDGHTITDKELEILNQSLSEALNNRAFGEAIRLIYLITLQNLIFNDLIVLQKDLPNRRILSQIRNHEIKSVTQGLFRFYEQVWFGKKSVTEVDFEEIDQLYKVFLASLTSNKR